MGSYTPLALLVLCSIIAAVHGGYNIKGYSQRYGDCGGHDIKHIVHTNLAVCTQQCNIRKNCRTFLFVARGKNSYCWLKNYSCPRLTATNHREYHFYNKLRRVVHHRRPAVVVHHHRRRHRCGGRLFRTGSLFRRTLFRRKGCPPGSKGHGRLRCRVVNLLQFLKFARRFGPRAGYRFGGFRMYRFKHKHPARKPRLTFYLRGRRYIFRPRRVYNLALFRFHRRKGYPLGRCLPGSRLFPNKRGAKSCRINRFRVFRRWLLGHGGRLFRLNFIGHFKFARKLKKNFRPGGWLNLRWFRTLKGCPKGTRRFGRRCKVMNFPRYRGWLRRFGFRYGITKRRFRWIHGFRFRFYKPLRHNLRKGRYLRIKWFRGLKHCMRGTKRAGGRCRVVNLRHVIRWIRRHGRRYHINLRHFPRIPSLIHFFRFRGRGPRRWRIRRRGGVRYRKGHIYFPGSRKSRASFRSIRFPGSFTVNFYVRPSRVKGRQTLIGSWVRNRWLYKLHLVNGRLGLWLRRNPNSNVAMTAAVNGGRLAPKRWYHVAFRWNSRTRWLRLYLNGKQVGARKSRFPRGPVYQKPGRTALGFKQDSNSEHFKGYISGLRIARGVVSRRRFIVLSRLIHKFKLHRGGFKFIHKLRKSFRFGGLIRLRWFRRGKKLRLKKCPRGTRPIKFSKKYGVRCRISKLVRFYHWIRKHSPRWRINFSKFPRPRIYRFARGTRRMHLYKGFHALGGTPIKGKKTSGQCRNWCARVRWCRAVDYNGQNRRCYYHRKPFRRIRATRRTCGVKQVWKIAQYVKARGKKPARYHPRGFTHRFGDCPGHDIAHFKKRNLRFCAKQCRIRPNCRTFLWVARGTNSYCWLKKSVCHRLTARNHRNYHFYNKRGGKRGVFKFWKLLRRNFKRGGTINLRWFRRKKCFKGTKRIGKSFRCKIIKLRWFRRFIRRKHRLFRIPINRLPQLPRLGRLFLFRRNRRGKKHLQLRGGVKIYKRKALYFPGRHNAYALGKNFVNPRRSFTISFFLKPQTLARNQILIANWNKRHYQFIFRLNKGGSLTLGLRRSHRYPNYDIVPWFTGGKLRVNRWSYVGFSWDHVHGVARIYVNRRVVATRKTKFRNHSLYPKPYPYFQLGYKMDSNNENFKGFISRLRFTRGVLSLRRFRLFFRYIRKLGKKPIHFGGFRFRVKFFKALRPFGRIDLRWFKRGKRVPKKCPHGTRRSRGRAAFDRFICVVHNLRLVYRWIRRKAPVYKFPLARLPKLRLARFAPGRGRMRLFRYRHSMGGKRIPGKFSSAKCRNWCARRRKCHAVDFVGAGGQCYVHWKSRRMIPATRKTTGQRRYWTVAQYRKVRPRPSRIHVRGYSHRYGDCPGHDVAHYTRVKNKHMCIKQCNRRKNCRSVLYVARGGNSYCWLKNRYCKRLVATRNKSYHFYTKIRRRFKFGLVFRKQVKKGGVIRLKWFHGIKRCMRGTKRIGKSRNCKVLHPHFLIRWIRRHHKRFHFNLARFPHVPRTYKVWLFNGRRYPNRWRIIRRGVKIVRRKALRFPGKRGHYATGPRFNKFRGSFTISFFMKPKTTSRNQILIGQWAPRRWQYLFRLWKGGALGLYLRGPRSNVGLMPALRGGRLVANRWYYVGFSYNHHTGVARIYVNGKVVATKKTNHKNKNLFGKPYARFQLGYKMDSNSENFYGLIANLRFTRGVLPRRRFVRFTRLIKKFHLHFGGFKATKPFFKNLRFGGRFRLSWFRFGKRVQKRCMRGTRSFRKGKVVYCRVVNLKHVYRWLRAYGPRYRINLLKLPKLKWYPFARGNKVMKFYRNYHSYGGKQLPGHYTSASCRNWCQRHHCYAVDFNGANNNCYVHRKPVKRHPCTAKSTGTRYYWKVGQYKKKKFTKRVVFIRLLRKHVRPGGILRLKWFRLKKCFPGTVKHGRNCKINKIHVFLKWFRTYSKKRHFHWTRFRFPKVWHFRPSGKIHGRPWYYLFSKTRKGIKRGKGPYGSKRPGFYFPGRPNTYQSYNGKLGFKSFTVFGWIKQNGIKDGPIIEWRGYKNKIAGPHVWIYRHTLYVNIVHNKGKYVTASFPRFKGMLPRNKWTFFGVSYNQKKGYVVMWLNGRTYHKRVGRVRPDTVGKLYMGLRPYNRKNSFKGWLSGVSVVPYAVPRRGAIKFIRYIFKVTGSKVPKGFLVKPKPRPRPKPKPLVLRPIKFHGHPLFNLFGLPNRKGPHLKRGTGPFHGRRAGYWFPGKAGFNFNALGVNPKSLTIFTFVKQPKFQNGPIVEWEGAKGKPFGTHFWIWGNYLFTNLVHSKGHYKTVTFKLKGSVPAKRWNFVGMTYNHKTGILIMWVNGNYYRKNVGKLNLDTIGRVYVGSRPRNPKFHPFRGYLSGTSVLPYAVNMKQLLSLRFQIVSRYYHIKRLPANFWWKVGYKPKPKPVVKPTVPKAPTTFTKNNLRPGGRFDISIFHGLGTCPKGTKQQGNTCVITSYKIFIVWLKIHSVQYRINFKALPVYTTTTTTHTTTQFSVGQHFPLAMFRNVCPKGTKPVPAKNPTQCEVTNAQYFISWLKINAKAYGIQFSYTSGGSTTHGGASHTTTTTTTSSGGGFQVGQLLQIAMFKGTCPSGTSKVSTAKGVFCKVGDITKFMAWLKVNAAAYHIQYSFGGQTGGATAGSSYSTTTQSSGGGAFSVGTALPSAMFKGHCPTGTAASGTNCTVKDVNAFMAWLKVNGSKYGISFSG